MLRSILETKIKLPDIRELVEGVNCFPFIITDSYAFGISLFIIVEDVVDDLTKKEVNVMSL